MLPLPVLDSLQHGCQVDELHIIGCQSFKLELGGFEVNGSEERQELLERKAEAVGLPEGGEGDFMERDVVIEALKEEAFSVGRCEVQRHSYNL